MAKRIISSGVVRRVTECSALQDKVARSAAILAGLDAGAMSAFSGDCLSIGLKTYRESVASKRHDEEGLLAQVRGDYEDCVRLEDRLHTLAQELRQLALDILNEGYKSNECPLCHTAFAPGQLEARISLNVDDRQNELGEKLLARQRELEASVRTLRRYRKCSRLAIPFCQRSGLAGHEPWLGVDRSMESQ